MNIEQRVMLHRCVNDKSRLGKVKEMFKKDSKAIRDIVRIHEHGFSVTRLRRTFMHLNGVFITGSNRWQTVSHAEYLTVEWTKFSDDVFTHKE